MCGHNDPLDGWSLKEVEETSSGPAVADIYGKVFYHVRAVLQALLLRLPGLQVSFRKFQVEASALPRYVEADSFNRIEVRWCSRPDHASGGFLLSIHANPLSVGVQHFGLRISWNTWYTWFNDAIASETSHQSTRDPYYSIHECC